MFKRSEKKIKAVFKMQFQATQVPQLKAKNLMISLVPVDVGKPTVRLAKTPIVEGNCTWENPVYETVKMIKEIKTGRIREKFYYVVVSTGSSKSGFLGEVSIDFADLAEATKPVNLTLPLQTSKSGAVLHVTVQNMKAGADSRHDEDSESYDPNLDAEEKDFNSFEKRNPKSPESDDLSESTSMHDEHYGSFGDAESDNSESNGTKLNQMKVLERKAELSELEVQSLRKQILKETRRGQQLSEQIDYLQEERDALKAECEQLKVSTGEDAFSSHTPKETENLTASLEKIKQELQREQHINKKLKFQVQKTEDSNSEFVLALRDLTKKLEQKNAEITRLSSKIKALHNGSEGIAASPRTKMDQNDEISTPEDLEGKHGHDVQMLNQKIASLYSEIEALKKEKAEIRMQLETLTQDYDSLEAENKDISSKLEQGETEKMELQQRYTECLAAEKKFKIQMASLETENKRQRRQYTDSLNMIDDIEFQVESLQKELEKQAQDFEDDLQGITELKVEQEQRAIRAEEALRKMRLSNANTTEQLQEEFKQVSAEMSSKIEENEKLAQQAVAEANDLHHKNEVLEGLLQKAKEEIQVIRDKHERTISEHTEQHKGIARSNQKESEILQRWKSEKEDLVRQLDSVMKEAEKLMHENVSMKSQIEQKKTKEDNLQLQVKKLRIKNNEAKSHLLELEEEKEDLEKEMSKLQGDLCKKEKELEKAHSSATKCRTAEVRKNQETMTSREINAVVSERRKNKGENGNDAEVRVSEDIPLKTSSQSNGGCDISSLLTEVASLKERNKSMDEELKEMHDRYSEISLRFAEVEGERQELVMALRNVKMGKKN